MVQLRDSLALIEVELVELREQAQTHITDADSKSLTEQLSQVKTQLEQSVQELEGQINNVKQERDSLIKELAEVKNNMKHELTGEKQHEKGTS